MIGQTNLLKQIDKLIEENKFPRFSIVTGQKGQGKTEVIKYISNKLNIPVIFYNISIDDIRTMIELAYKCTQKMIFVIKNGDNMSINAQNSLLKVIEEPPYNCYIVLELNDINNTLETIRSRCQEFKMENYTQKEIDYMIDNITLIKGYPMTLQEKSILDNIAKNYYQIELLIKYGIEKFYQFVEKVVDNIYKVQSANAFKLEEKLDIKGDGNGYDLDLFFQTFNYICFNRAWEIVGIDNKQEEHNKYINSIIKTTQYKNKLNIKGINKMRNFRPDGY